MTAGQHRELESKMKCFLHHPAPSAASLFFVSSVPPKVKGILAGFVLVCVYGWMLSLIVNGAIRPLLYVVSIGVWQRIWQMLYLHSGNIYTKDRAFTAFSFTIISTLIQEGNCVRMCVLPAAKDLVLYVCGSLRCTWEGALLSGSGDIALIKVSGEGKNWSFCSAWLKHKRDAKVPGAKACFYIPENIHKCEFWAFYFVLFLIHCFWLICS